MTDKLLFVGVKDYMKRILAIFFAVIATVGIVFPNSYAAAANSVLAGDLDEDGRISATDARTALRFSVDLDYYTAGHLKIGDFDENGKFGASDARFILRASVGLEDVSGKTVKVTEDDFKDFINKQQINDIFKWEVPETPKVEAAPGTFTFTVYGYGHGVGLSQYGAVSMDEAGYTYDKILSHYFKGTEIKLIEEFPEMTKYPTYEYDEAQGKEVWKQKEYPTEELLARIVYLEIYGITDGGKYDEALKALTLCVFSNMAHYDFDIENRWDVGLASELPYEQLPETLKNAVRETLGRYIVEKGKTEPITAVYSALSAGMTAACEDIWGGAVPYLVPVPSPFDMKRENYISMRTYTVEEMREMILSYDSSIVLSDDPSEWIMITEHTGAIDETRGYVKKIKVGDRILKGYNQFLMDLMNNDLRSPCFTVTYTPYDLSIIL